MDNEKQRYLAEFRAICKWLESRPALWHAILALARGAGYNGPGDEPKYKLRGIMED